MLLEPSAIVFWRELIFFLSCYSIIFVVYCNSPLSRNRHMTCIAITHLTSEQAITHNLTIVYSFMLRTAILSVVACSSAEPNEDWRFFVICTGFLLVWIYLLCKSNCSRSWNILLHCPTTMFLSFLGVNSFLWSCSILLIFFQTHSSN